MKTALAAVILVLVVCLLLAAWCLRAGGAVGGAAARAPRGADPARSPHVVVDTLNLAHWLRARRQGGAAPLGPSAIVESIDATAPTLKLRHSGRVMYVLKDRESQLNDDAARALYKAAAARNGVYVYLAERYADPPAASAKAPEEHSARGRDDFFIALLARRWRCAVLTEDRLRDFDRFRATVQPFHVYEYAFWRDLPHREFVRPDAAAHAQVRKPRMVRYAEYFSQPG